MEQAWTRKNEMLYAQHRRMLNFPCDRVPFLKGSDHAARLDKIVLTAWYKGKMSSEDAREAIAKNNYLDEVTKEQFDTLCRMCGYRRKNNVSD